MATSSNPSTTIRPAIILKPRLRKSPTPPTASSSTTTRHKPIRPRSTTPATNNITPNSNFDQTYPPSNVFLHPDDAQSKVYLAIARSLLSVDNRAMTVKDLAQMCMDNGLVAQNVNAASQAITTYLRSHLQRCSEEDDQPLLLRHFLSGTQADDDLAPALHSLSGGAHVAQRHDTAARKTNFRKSTQVWYLSRAAGASCPFSRAGIRLCDYVDSSLELAHTQQQREEPPKKRLRQRTRERQSRRLAAQCDEAGEIDDQATQCGQKRKRGSDASSTSPLQATEPPRIKLTLRLKPLAQVTASIAAAALAKQASDGSAIIDLSRESESDSSESSESDDDDAMSIVSSHTDVSDDAVDSQCSSSSFPSLGLTKRISSPFRRSSPSAVSDSSSASPPPDSDEEEGYSLDLAEEMWAAEAEEHEDSDMAHEESDEDFDLDSSDDEDGETSSPGPRSPSAPLSRPGFGHVHIKEEPRDVQGILDAWRDQDQLSGNPNAVNDILGHVASQILTAYPEPQVKPEEWDWSYSDMAPPSPFADTEAGLDLPPSSASSFIKQEEQEMPFFSSDGDSFMRYRSPNDSPSSPLLSPISPFSSEPSHRSFSFTSSASDIDRRHSDFGFSPLTLDSPSFHRRPSIHEEPLAQSLTSLIDSLQLSLPSDTTPSDELSPPILYASPSPSSACVSPHEMDIRAWRPYIGESVEGAAHSSNPPQTAIWMTSVEGVFVYNMRLGSQTLIRRVDSDFVNLTPLAMHSGSPLPVMGTVADSVVCSSGPEIIQGVWVPLHDAEVYVNDHPVRTGGMQGNPDLALFLSHDLKNSFAPAVAGDVHLTSSHDGAFGRPFTSMMNGHASTDAAAIMSHLQKSPVPSYSPIDASSEAHPTVDLPLSSKEEEMFQELCVNLDWEPGVDTETPSTPVAPKEQIVSRSSSPEEESSSRRKIAEQPLRRSKRVANAVVASTRVKTRARR